METRVITYDEFVSECCDLLYQWDVDPLVTLYNQQLNSGNIAKLNKDGEIEITRVVE